MPENLPEQYQQPHRREKGRKEKLPSKKRWMELMQLKLNPKSLTAEEFISIKNETKDSKNPFKDEQEREMQKAVELLRDERLRQQGLNPSEWTFLQAAQPSELRADNMNAQFTEKDLERLSTIYPDGLEFYAIQGHLLGGEEQPVHTPPAVLEHTWEVYVRLKLPQELTQPPPQLEPPTSDTQEPTR